MNSSGIKRGLAISAVSAMAITGVGLASPAFADSIAQQNGNGNGVSMVSGTNGDVSPANDGTDTTVHLVALGQSNVAQVQFSYDGNNIGSPVVASPGGYFEIQWTPPAAIYNTSVNIVAQGLDSNGNALGSDSAGATVKPGGNAVNLSSTPNSVGVYDGPNGLIGSASGTTNDLSGPATAKGDISLNSQYGSSTNADTVSTVQTGDTSRTFSGTVDFTGYPWDSSANGKNEAVIWAGDDSDDATSVNLYKQTITTVTATADNTSVQTGSTATVTVNVQDQNGKPVAGVTIQEVGGGSAITDSQGNAVFSGLAGSAGGTTYDFFTDNDNSGVYDSGTEIRRSVTITEYSAAATGLTASATQSAYDFNEVNGSSFTASLKDQHGNGMAGALNYQWTVTPFDGSTATAQPIQHTTAAADGSAAINGPSGSTPGSYQLVVWQENDGTPGPSGNDLVASPVNVKIGDGAIVWDDGDRVSVKQGTSQTFKGSVQLEDGTKLPSRTISVHLYRGGDAVLAPQAAQTGPGDVTRIGDLDASIKTDANGDFGLVVADPASTITTSPDYGDELYGSGTNFDSGWLRTDFMDTTVAHVYSYGDPFSENLGQPWYQDTAPGIPQRLENIRVTNAAGQSLVGVPITLSVDHGYFTPDTNTGGTDLSKLSPATPAAQGGVIGDWKNSGTSITVTSGDHGNVGHNYAIAIGKDDGFAAGNGQLTTTLKITAGGVSPTTAPTINWDATYPINPGALTIAFSGDQGTYGSRILPKASTDLDVYLTPTATDQFGNTTGQDVALTNAGVGNAPSDADSRFSVWTDEAGDETVSGKVTDDVYKWGADANSGMEGYQPSVDNSGSQDLTAASPTINWYDVDLSASSYNLTHNTANKVKPGTTVTETYTAKDQNGQPLAGYDVGFLRTGPDPLQNGNGSGFGETNANGVATYIFQGTKAGKAIITGIMEDHDGNAVAASQVNDTVTFQAAGQVSIRPHLKLSNSGSKDVATVQTSRAAKGAKVTFYRVNSHGHAVKIGTAKLGKNGKVTKKFSDKNGNKVTRYFARVAATAKTFKAKTPTKGIR